MIKLTITEKGGEPRALSFDQNEVSIGRVQGNDIVLPKGNISKRHSRLTLTDGRMIVADAKSTNGTYVNGRKIGEATVVRPGDKIFVGDFLIVVDPGAAVAEISSTGSRRGPPPPPPPPPRPGLATRMVMPSDPGENEDAGGGFGGLGEKAPPTGRGGPPVPPPPPPPRRTVTTSLQDDSVDIGIDEPPPSPDEVAVETGTNSRDGGDAMGSLAADIDDAAPSVGSGSDDGRSGDGRSGDERSGDGGSDVFGFRPAADEDAASRGTDSAVARSSAAAPSNRMVSPDVTAGGGASLDALLADPAVTGILIGAGGSVQVERGGRFEPAGPVGDGNTLAETVWQIANTAVPPPASDNPVVDVRLLDGTRITALFPPISSGSVAAAIRKVTQSEITLGEIAGSGDVEKILGAAISSRRNLLLCGDAPGVAVLLSALTGLFPSERRIVSIGSGTKARAGWIELGAANDPAGLVRAAVAFRADHLLVADAGGSELPELLLAAARGQEGIIATLPARSAAEALTRLRAFSVGALGVPGFASLVSSTVDLIVLAGTTAAGSVRVLEIAEPNADGEALSPSYVARRPEKSRTTTTLDVSGVSPRLAAAIAVSTDTLPAHLVRR